MSSSVKRIRSVISWVALSLPFFVGTYVLLLVLAPGVSIPIINEQPDVARQLEQTKPNNSQNRIYIPKINVDVAIAEGTTSAALQKGAWHRKPENGDPVKGGNFVLAAHRFRIAWTPEQTSINSPFYRIDKLKPGDEIIVDYDGTRHTYIVDKTYAAPPTAVEIESPSQTPRLTLYSCDLRAQARVVVEALPQP